MVKYYTIRHSISFEGTEKHLGKRYPESYVHPNVKKYDTIVQARKALMEGSSIWTTYVASSNDGKFFTICGAIEKPVHHPFIYVTTKGEWLINKNGTLGKRMK